MPVIGHFQQAVDNRRDFPLAKGMCWAGNVLQQPAGDVTPHVFYVEQEPHSVAGTHYHDACQFQVVVHGGGAVGSHGVSPFSVHYAGFQTVYGPLVAGADGLGYLTMRIQAGVGIHFWPQEREHIVRGIRRGQSMGHADAGAEGETDLIPSGDAGLAARSLRIAPGAEITVQPDAASAGAFCVVAEGEATLADTAMTRLDVAWIGREESPALRAGAQGAQLIVLQMPAEALSDRSRMESAAE